MVESIDYNFTCSKFDFITDLISCHPKISSTDYSNLIFFSLVVLVADPKLIIGK